jgi:L-ascorbate metabolism protein UlaG (beta-lactamase superfamily)
MRIRWYGQSAFLLTGADHRVFIDPFGDPAPLVARGIEFGYPLIDDVEADVLLVTHDHFDHNAVDRIGGEPVTLTKAGTHASPIGEIVGIASEHDPVAGTQRGQNAIFVFALDGVRLCHFGDFGQHALRPEQRDAIGEIDVVFLPVGAGPTVGGEEAAAIVRELRPRLVVGMHYRTPAINFLDPPDAFLDALGATVKRPDESEVEVEPLLGTPDGPVVALLKAPVAS